MTWLEKKDFEFTSNIGPGGLFFFSTFFFGVCVWRGKLLNQLQKGMIFSYFVPNLFSKWLFTMRFVGRIEFSCSKKLVPSFWKPVMLGIYHRRLTKLFGFIAPHNGSIVICFQDSFQVTIQQSCENNVFFNINPPFLIFLDLDQDQLGIFLTFHLYFVRPFATIRSCHPKEVCFRYDLPLGNSNHFKKFFHQMGVFPKWFTTLFTTISTAWPLFPRVFPEQLTFGTKECYLGHGLSG